MQENIQQIQSITIQIFI